METVPLFGQLIWVLVGPVGLPEQAMQGDKSRRATVQRLSDGGETCCLCTLVRGCLLVTAKVKMTFYSFLSCASQELGGSDGVCHTCNQGQDSDHLGSWLRVP